MINTQQTERMRLDKNKDNMRVNLEKRKDQINPFASGFYSQIQNQKQIVANNLTTDEDPEARKKAHTSQGLRKSAQKARRNTKQKKLNKMVSDFDIKIRQFNYIGVPIPNHVEA